MLGSAKLVAFAACRDFERAKAFYNGVLGLPVLNEDHFAITFDANGTTLRVSKVAEVAAAPYTVLGWEVADIETTVRELTARGVFFQIYPGVPQDELGIWTVPGGAAKVAWFKDPDGNLLSVSQ